MTSKPQVVDLMKALEDSVIAAKAARRALKAAPQPAPATAQVMPVLAAITQAPAWGVSVDGRLVATCGREDDAHTLRRLINEAGGL